MKLKSLFLYSILSMGMFCACSEDTASVIPEPEPKPEVKPVTIDFPNGKVPNLNFAATGGKEQIQFYTIGEWKASLPTDKDASEWITITPASGSKGFQSIEVVALENKEVKNRETILTLTTKDDKKQITIAQEEKKLIQVDKSEIKVKHSGDTFQLNVKANVEYDVQIDVDWISLQTTRTLSEKQLTFVVAKYGKKEDRSGKITLTAKDKSCSQTIIVTQSGKDTSIDDWESGNEDWWKPSTEK